MENSPSHLHSLAGLGFSLIPMNGKRPIEADWTRWCREVRPFREEDFTGHNAGICCGPASGIIVLDIDDIPKFQTWAAKKNIPPLAPTREHATGGGGLHRLYRYPANGHRYGNKSLKDAGFDIRGDGGCIVAPGSIHPDTGNPYTVSMDHPVVDSPQWLLDLCREKPPAPSELPAIERMTWGGDIDSLPIRHSTKELIRSGAAKGARSESIMTVLTALVGAGASEGDIFKVFDAYPIGEKYREKGNAKERWLHDEIERARTFVATPGKPECDSLAFPSHIMTGGAGYFAGVLSDCMEPPRHFFFMAYLTCLGAILSNRITLKTELRPQARLFLVILGESADDRKSTAVSKTVDFFLSAVPDFRVCFGVGSAEGLQRRFQKDNDPKGSSVLLVYDELKAFVGKAKVDGSVLLPCVCTLFESNRYESHTRDREIILTGACLSILAASTIETYERTWDAAFQDIGMTNRLFIVPGQGKRQHAIPSQVHGHEWATMKSDLVKILRTASMTPELDITPRARALYESWYLTLEQSIHTKRLDTYALRFLILLAANASKSEVDEPIVQDAIDLMNWQLQARRMHDPIDADSAVAKIEEKVRRILTTGPRSDRDLKRAVHYNRIGTWVFSNAVRNLTKSNEIYFSRASKSWGLK